MTTTRHREQLLPARRLTPERKHFFFGYYDKFCTNADDRLLLALNVPFLDHLPGPHEPATVGVFDLTAKRRLFHPIGQANAWCWQQSNMLQWLPEDPARLAVHNDFRDGQFVAVVRDVSKGGTEDRILPRPIYTLSQTGPLALSLTFPRVYAQRPGYGYPNAPDPNAADPVPDNDGVWAMDTRTGTHRLVLSIARAARLEPSVADWSGARHWVNHIQINPTGTRFAVLHRFRAPDTGRSWITRLITANLDGSDARVLATPMVSHYDWRDQTQILAWAYPKPLLTAFYIIEDRARPAGCPVPWCHPVAVDTVRADGHCNFSPDRRFFVNDTYPNRDRLRTLMLVRWDDESVIDIGRFLAPAELDGEHRCDLHPRWFRNGLTVCFDSVHEGYRGIYAIDVAAVVGAG